MPGSSDGFLDLPPRPGKPRAEGLTHVIDKGLNLRDIEGMFDTAGEYVDIVKLGWGTATSRTTSRRRSRSTAPSRRRSSAAARSSRPSTRAASSTSSSRGCADHRFSHVEISDGTLEIPRERKLELIADFARDFTVLSEVGSKDAEVVFAPYQWVEWIKERARGRRVEGDHRGPRGRHRGHLPPDRRDAHRASSTRSCTRSPPPS